MAQRGSTDGSVPKATLAYAERSRPAAPALDRPVSPALDQTVAASVPGQSTLAPAGSVRSTVLPRIERASTGGTHRVVVEGKPRYQELRPLGSGGQAEVTLVRDHDIDRAVALKRLLPEQNDDASVLRFAEEIRTVGQLETPNIVPIHDVGVDEQGHYFFVMKYVQGETLESIINKLREGDQSYLARYTPEFRLQICNEILRGVQHAHELGILHRDLKPGNVMIGSLGEVVVMDWGLAKKIADGAEMPVAAPAVAPQNDAGPSRLFQTQAGALLGTPAYMAPEQAAGRLDEVDARSDVYSLAVMFYEFLSLQHPRAHCTTVAEMIASVIEEPITVRQAFTEFTRAGAPAALAHFVRHGLDRDPKRRYPTVAAMRERLESVRDGKVKVECHVTFTQRLLSTTARAVDHHPFLLGFGYLAAIAGIGDLLVRLLVH